MKNLHITLLVSLIWSSFCFAQKFTNYSTKNGLPSNNVYRITQDVDGFIWFITDKGMVKYNGTDFKKFTIRKGLATNDIWNVIAAPDGKVWYFSKSPKIGYIKNDSIYAFPSKIKGEILNPTNRSIINNEVTFNNSEAHYELINKHWQKHNTFGNFSKLRRYINLLKHPVLDRFQYDKKTPTILFFNKSNVVVKKIKYVKPIEYSHTRSQINDSIYVWLSDKNYTILNLNTYKLKTIWFKDVINIKKSKYVRIHKVNNQIQITGVGFVSVLDKNYNLTNTYYTPDYLKGHFSFIDKQNNVWIATLTNGVYKLSASKKNAVYSLINNRIGKIKKINNHIIATVLNKGFYQYNCVSKQFTPYIKDVNFSYGVYDIKELNKQYFITSNKITTMYNGKKSMYYALKKENFFNEIARQLVYHDNYLYGNFTSGLNKLNTQNFSVNKRYLINGIRTFTSFKNKLIIATSNGLKTLNNNNIQNFTIGDSVSNKWIKKPILSLNKLNSNWLLVGTDSYGAFLTDLNKTIPLKETEYLSINDSFIENNNLWLATDVGVLHYKKDERNNYNFITTYNENDGLLLKSVRSVYANKGELIISSNIGAVTIPKKKKKNKPLLDVYFSSVHYNNKKLTLNKAKYIKNNTLSLNISGINFTDNANFDYEYQLLPIQEKWIATNSKQIIFNDLKPHNYELRIWSENKIKRIKFKIVPLWYQTKIIQMLFGLLYVLFIAAIITYFIKRALIKKSKSLQIQKKLADFELHALRSQMNPHFVFNSLNAIQYYITKNEIELSEKYLVKFSRLIRMFFDFSREKEITLSEEVKLLKNYLEIEKMRFGNDFKFNFILDKNLNLNKYKIPTMLLQPIVENAVNHGVFHNGGKGLIEITFNSVNHKTYQVIIKDDGVGVEKSRKIQQQSLKVKRKSNANSTDVINERIELLNESNLWIVNYKLIDHSKTIGGTTVQLTFTKNE